MGLGALLAAAVSGAAGAPVGLGTAGSFAVLAGQGVTNTGPSVIRGDLGTCPNPAITGFPPGLVFGEIHAADAEACQAQSDLVIAYNDAAGRAPTTIFAGPTDLGGMTLPPGVYSTPSSFAITGTLVLDAQGDPDAVFIFQAGSTLITAPNSRVVLINGAQACNVFWQVGSSATLGVGSTFVGTILALTSITANTNAVVTGRLLARNGAVTLDSNVVTTPGCRTTTTTTVPTSTSSTLPTSTSSTSSTLPTSTSSTSSTLPTSTSSTSSTLPTSTSSTLPTTSSTLPTTSTLVTTTTRPTTTTTTTTRPTTTTTTRPTTTTTTRPTTTTSSTTVAPTTTTTRATTTTTLSTTVTTAGGGAATRSASNALGSRRLSITGSPVRWELFAGGTAVALGGLILLATRRRRGPDGS